MLKEDILLEMCVRFFASFPQYVCISKISSGDVFRCYTTKKLSGCFSYLPCIFSCCLGLFLAVGLQSSLELCTLHVALLPAHWALSKLSRLHTLIGISKSQTYAVPFRFPICCFSFTWCPSSLNWLLASLGALSLGIRGVGEHPCARQSSL